MKYGKGKPKNIEFIIKMKILVRAYMIWVILLVRGWFQNKVANPKIVYIKEVKVKKNYTNIQAINLNNSIFIATQIKAILSLHFGGQSFLI